MSPESTIPKLFGTDGIRGRAGLWPFTAEGMLRLGEAAAAVLASRCAQEHLWPTCVVGRDTRLSGDMIVAALSAGLASRGVDVVNEGILPTPAIALLTRERGAAFGIVVSASHNPAEDNGVKFFGPDGHKLPDELEAAIERAMAEGPGPQAETFRLGRISNADDGADRYIHSVEASVDHQDDLFAGMKIALDAANGAAYHTSEAILRALGAEVVPFHYQPDGLNINRDCGATHPETIAALVLETHADAGIAHDGDADRVVLCDETGVPLDGDDCLAIGGLDLLERGELAGCTVVATVMSNFGLDAWFAEKGVHVMRTSVGDRHVIEAMRAGNHNFGGEQSGHLIYRDHNTTGDGILAAVHLLAAVRRSGQKLSELRRLWTKFPQCLVNVPIATKPAIDSLPEVCRLIAETEAALDGQGRVLVRYSGTETLARILVEGRDEAYIANRARDIAEAIVAAAGAA